jgi:hypothetical protein
VVVMRRGRQCRRFSSAELYSSVARARSNSFFDNAAFSRSDRFVFFRPVSTRPWYRSKSSCEAISFNCQSMVRSRSTFRSSRFLMVFFIKERESLASMAGLINFSSTILTSSIRSFFNSSYSSLSRTVLAIVPSGVSTG